MVFDRIVELCRMNVLVIAATEKELTGIKEISFDWPSIMVQTAVTGVGLMPSTYALMQFLIASRPDVIIQLGIAGGFNPSIELGTAVTVRKEMLADMGVYETSGYRDIFEMGLTEKNSAPFEKGAIVNHHENLIEALSLPVVSAVSVNEISTSTEKIKLFSEKYKADIESMEGAALHYVCTLQQIPFVQIRGISNLVGERDKSKWKIPESLHAATNACINLINKIQLP
jgi:futalosine hydrolase